MIYIHFIFVFLIGMCPLLCNAQSVTVLPSDSCLKVVNEFQTLANHEPKLVEREAQRVLETLRNGTNPVYYYIAYNIYAENIFNQGKVDKARQVIVDMQNDPAGADSPECQAIALRAQGQFYYKIGLYPKAVDCFKEAKHLVGHYQNLESPLTFSSIMFWLIQAEIQAGQLDDAQQEIAEVEKMARWLDNNGICDNIGYRHVMIYGLEAKADLLKGETDRAAELIARCPEYIQEGIPARAYVEYYVARMMLLLQQGSYDDALQLLDQLIEMHISDYRPIAVDFLYQKAETLMKQGRYHEAAETFTEYLQLKKEVDEVAIAQQLDELRTRYEVENLRQEQSKIHLRFIIVLVVCLSLIVIVAGYYRNYRKLRLKNVALVRSIKELNRNAEIHSVKPVQMLPENYEAEDEAKEMEASDEEHSNDKQNQEYLEKGQKIVEFIHNSKCYLKSDCGRDKIKEGLGISEQVLSKAMPAATGMTFVNYINSLRLQSAVDMLEKRQDLTISQISGECGFGTLRQFQRCFKLRYGLSPSAFRDACHH